MTLVNVRIPGKIINKANSYRVYRKRPVPSVACMKYQRKVADVIRASGVLCERFAGDVAMNVVLCNQKIDIDGIKVLPDALQDAQAIENDRQIMRLTVEKVEESGPPYVGITLTTLDRGVKN